MKAQNLYFIALEKKYESQVAEAKATLHTYFNSSVGIGEHSDLLEEFDKHVEVLATAEDKLATLRRNFDEYQANAKVSSNGHKEAVHN